MSSPMLTRPVQILARPGSPFKGHDCGAGNSEQVLEYESEAEPSLTKWVTGGWRD